VVLGQSVAGVQEFADGAVGEKVAVTLALKERNVGDASGIVPDAALPHGPSHDQAVARPSEADRH
jgi:hypothetical protein